MTVQKILLLTDQPQQLINKHYAHKQEKTEKSKTHINYRDGTEIIAKKTVEAIKGIQADAVIVGKNIDDESYDQIVKTRVKNKNGIVVKL